MALPKEPRQKMINMMYLVLTALLAINVSAEILNAFKTVDHGINRSNDLFIKKSKDQFAAFDKAIGEQGAAKVMPFRTNAVITDSLANQACEFIDGLKLKLMMLTGGKAPNGEGYNEGEMEGPTRLMDNLKQGVLLRDSLIRLREDFLKMVPPSQRNMFEVTLPLKIDTPEVENKGNRDWVGAHFRMVPAVASLTIMDKFENDIRASANAIIEDNLSQINALDIKLDQFEPYISANSLYLMNGQQFSATIGVGAFSSAINPEITVDGQPLPVSLGKGVFTTTASGAGSHTVHVNIRLKKPDGTFLVKDEDIIYNVGSSTFAVSADLTKVVFRGIDNPISCSGGGVGAEGLNVSATNANLVKIGAGKYNLRPGELNESRVTVIAHRPDGSSSTLGSETFLVKDLPNPVAYVGAFPGGRMHAAEFRIQTGMRAVLEGFDFLSGVRFEITGFTVYAVGGDELPTMLQGASTSYSFDPVQSIIKKCKPNTIVSFEDIHAKGPDNKNRKIRGISFQLY